MNQNTKSVLRRYWLTMAAGFVASFGIFIGPLQRLPGEFWFPGTFAVGTAGYSMLVVAFTHIRQRQPFNVTKQVLIGLVWAVLVGLIMYLAPLYMGYIVFYLLYAGWITLAIGCIYFAVHIRRLASSDRTGP